MVSLNADNNTPSNKCQDNNFAIVKLLLEYTWQLDITLSALRILNYQIHQEFGFIQNGNVKNGDKVAHTMRSRHLGISKNTEIEATQELERLNVLIVERKHRIVNRYHINRDVSTWILRKPTDKVNVTKESHNRGETDFSSNTNNTTETKEWVDVEYIFNRWQLMELHKFYTDNDLETEKLWLNAHGIPQDKAFGTLLRKVTK